MMSKLPAERFHTNAESGTKQPKHEIIITCVSFWETALQLSVEGTVSNQVQTRFCFKRNGAVMDISLLFDHFRKLL
jgi:PIN domain nuclease of toxin-antitoxin system